MARVWKRNWTTAKGERRVAWAVDFFDANGERVRKQFPSRREADAYRVEIEGQLRTGTFRLDAERVTVKEVGEQFLAHCEGRMNRGERMVRHTYEMYCGHVWNYIAPDAKRHEGKRRHHKMVDFDGGIGAVRLSRLSARAVGDFRDRLRDAGVSVPTTRKIIGTLKVMLQYAISRDLLAVNAAKGIKVIGRRDEGSKRIVPPSKEAMRRLIEVADADFKVALVVASATGVRAGELHALRWRHLDLDKGEVTIETRVDAYRREDVTKTAAGMRTVPLAAPVVLLLKAWRLRTKRKKDDELVFPNKRGWYVSHDNMVKRKFHPLFEELAKLHAENPTEHLEPPARFNWHALRHFAISCWIEAGLSPKTVQTFAGHSSLSVTMDRYGHLFQSDDHKLAMEAIAKAMLKG